MVRKQSALIGWTALQVVNRNLYLASRFVVGKSLSAEGDFRDHLVGLLHLINKEANIPGMLNDFPKVTQLMSFRARFASYFVDCIN